MVLPHRHDTGAGESDAEDGLDVGDVMHHDQCPLADRMTRRRLAIHDADRRRLGRVGRIEKRRVGDEPLVEAGQLRSNDHGAARLDVVEELLLHRRAEELEGRQQHRLVSRQAIGGQSRVGQQERLPSLRQRLVEGDEPVVLDRLHRLVEAEGLLRGGHEVRILGKADLRLEEVARIGNQHARGLKAIVIAVGEEQHVGLPAQRLEVERLQHLVGGREHRGVFRADAAVAANWRG